MTARGAHDAATGESERLNRQAREAERIRREYEMRAARLPAGYYALSNPGVLFERQCKERTMLDKLHRHRLFPLRDRRILDVGCGSGQWLVDFETWGAERRNLAGIDLIPARVESARARLGAWRDERGALLSPGADIRVGDAVALPWPDASFDIVCQSMAFSSILDRSVQASVAQEIMRVLQPGGVIAWYDFFLANPNNPNVRGVRRKDIENLFPGFSVDLKRVTLAQPLARRLVPISRVAAELLQAARILNTHFMGVLVRLPRVA